MLRNNLDARSGGMGRAYVAISDTLVGAYYNPAGLSFIDQTRKTESSSIHRFESLKTTKLDTGLSYTLNIESNTPPFIGFFQQFDGFNLGISMITPKSDIYDQVIIEDASGKYSEVHVDGKQHISLIGPSISTLVSDTLSVGLSLFYSQESKKEIATTTLIQSSIVSRNISIYNTHQSKEILSILGVQWMPSSILSIGAKISYPIFLSGNTDFTTVDSLQFFKKSSANLNDTNYQTNLPAITLGSAFFVSDTTLLAADIQYMPQHSSDSSARKSVYNIAIGAEHYYTPMIPLRFGFFTNPSYKPDGADGDHIDTYGFTSSIGYEFGANALNAGIEYMVGSGHSLENGTKTHKLNYNSLTFTFGGSSQI
jgi:hypothetical protein